MHYQTGLRTRDTKLNFMDYLKSLQNMSGRYNPDNAPLLEQRILSGELSYDKDVVKYVKRAMCAVGEDYTKRTIEAGEAAKQHLKDSIRNISFEYQGSVMTNTHIRGASDIDLLVMCEKFYGTWNVIRETWNQNI